MANYDSVFALDGARRDGSGGDRRRHGRYLNNALVQEPPTRPRRQPLRPPPPPPARQVNPLMLRFLFDKRLQNSDVSAAGRIVIPKGPAEMHLPNLSDKRGFWIYLYDFSRQNVWPVKFRFWPNHRSKMYVFENTREFVVAHGLVAGDSIEVFKDEEHGSFVLRGIKHIVNADHVVSSSQNDDSVFASLLDVDLGSSYNFGNRDVPEIEPSLDFSLIFG